MTHPGASAIALAALLAGCGARSGLSTGDDASAPARRDAGGPTRPDAGGPGCRPETCNALDDDCDGSIDEGLRAVLFTDGDGDGFGGGSGTTRCPAPGVTEVGGDCDDARPEISPGARERCRGGTDEDCDGAIDCDDADCACVPDEPVEVGPTTFLMGSPEREDGREADEVRHEVTITRAFEVMRTELTQRAWREVTDTSPAFHRGCGDECPVETISWWEALAFANALGAREGLPPCYELLGCSGELGRGCVSGDSDTVTGCETAYRCADVVFAGLDCPGYRLPTESEWELAARGGSTSAWPVGDDVDRVNEIGWCAEAAGELHPVAELRANPWGLFDTAGNVYEWVWDFYGDYPDGPLTDPLGPRAGDARCMRGGSYAFGDYTCRSANRGARRPDRAFAYIGLRLVRTLP